MSLSKHFCGILSASLCTLMLSMTSCQEKGNKEQCSLIPQPNELKTNTGHFAFNNSTQYTDFKQQFNLSMRPKHFPNKALFSKPMKK